MGLEIQRWTELASIADAMEAPKSEDEIMLSIQASLDRTNFRGAPGGSVRPTGWIVYDRQQAITDQTLRENELRVVAQTAGQRAYREPRRFRDELQRRAQMRRGSHPRAGELNTDRRRIFYYPTDHSLRPFQDGLKFDPINLLGWKEMRTG